MAARRTRRSSSSPIEERTTAGGVRELLRAVVIGAALVDTPEYDTTRAEVRTRQTRSVAWWRR